MRCAHDNPHAPRAQYPGGGWRPPDGSRQRWTNAPARTNFGAPPAWRRSGPGQRAKPPARRMENPIQIVPLSRDARPVMRFLKVRYRVYANDPLWVAPLLTDLKKVFTDANPLFRHAELALWVAVQDGQDVGRIAGVIDHNYNRTQKDSAAFFGFFECVDDAARQPPAVRDRDELGARPRGASRPGADEPDGERRVRPAGRRLRFIAGLHDDLQPPLLRGPGGRGGVSQGQGPAGLPHGRGEMPARPPGAHRGQDEAPASRADVLARPEIDPGARSGQGEGGLQRGLGGELGFRADDRRRDGFHGGPPQAAACGGPGLAGRDARRSRWASCWRCRTTTSP